jgi:hypothetical protein
MTRHFPTYFHILCTYFADYCVMSLAVRSVLAMSSVPKEWGPTKPETHAKRQGTKHGCLPSLLSDGDQGGGIHGGAHRAEHGTISG